MRGEIILVIIYIYTVSIRQYSKYPIYVQTKGKKTRSKTKEAKNAERRRETECFQNQNFHIEIEKMQTLLFIT